MAKVTYTAKRHPESGKWSVYDDKGRLESRIGVNFTRSTARKYAFLLNSGRMLIEKRDPMAMPHSGVPGQQLLRELEAKQREERENFEKNKFAILAQMREAERAEAAPFKMH